MKNVAVLGSTGSIGRQTLDVIGHHPAEFNITALTAASNTGILIEQIERFKPEYVGILDGEAARLIAQRYPHIEVVTGGDINALPALNCVDIAVNGISGFAGLQPLINALSHGKTVALANKESIVCGHHAVEAAIKKGGGRILPVDSEQSAIFQCLAAGKRRELKSILLTASGGPFRDFTRAQLEEVTVEMALAHPTWRMGAKITIDSASLFNKGLELMEAAYLFNVSASDIRILIHPQSIVHSMTEFCDGSVFAQMSVPDMRLAIQYALTYPERLPCPVEPLDLTHVAQLSFFAPDEKRFPAIPLAYAAYEAGGTLPIAYNAANEVAVDMFKRGIIKFTDIAECVAYTMGKMPMGNADTVEAIISFDDEARRIALRCFGKEK